MPNPIPEVRYNSEDSAWLEIPSKDVTMNDDGTADVFIWGYVLRDCEVFEEPGDIFSPECKSVYVLHPTGNHIRAYWL